jgi:tripartite-type tricarboxylate transporter receptor subunit TctC
LGGWPIGAELVAVLAGEVSLMFASTSDVVRLVRAGRLRGLAVTSARRIPALPDTPTMIEAGLPGYDATAWFGVLAPACTPVEIVTNSTRYQSCSNCPDRGDYRSAGPRGD